METLDANSSSSSSSLGGVNSDDNNGSVTWYGMRLPSVNPFLSPVSFLLDYSGILRSTNDSEAVIVNNGVSGSGSELRSRVDTDTAASVAGSSAGEVAIRIIGAGESIQNQVGELGYDDCGEDLIGERSGMSALDDDDGGGAGSRGGIEASEGVPLVSSSSSSSLAGSGRVDGDASVNGSENNSRDSSSYQRYDIQLVAKWIEQILPFSLLLLVVFIRQHLQGITTCVLIHWLCYCYIVYVMLISASNLCYCNIIIVIYFTFHFLFFFIIITPSIMQILGKFKVVSDNLANCWVLRALACLF